MLRVFAICLNMLIASSLFATERPQLLSLADGVELEIKTYPAAGKRLFIWLPSEAGMQAAHPQVATALQKAGDEVWLADWLAAYFLPAVESSLDHIPAEALTPVLKQAAASGKQIFLVTSGRGVIPLLRGAQLWQRSENGSAIPTGVILLSPKFFIETPDPGQAAQLMPSVENTNLPVFILQPQQSPWFWKLNNTAPALAKSGSDVFIRRLANVRDRFYYRPDASEYEQQVTKQLPRLLQDSARLLTSLPTLKRTTATITTPVKDTASGKKERTLKPYQGNPQPPALDLKTLNGNKLDLKDYRDKVVLVNFWASWCPPCVHEMPSMQALQDHFTGKPFTILAVNMAETANTIHKFLQEQVKVDFPILLDEDGAALKRWQVFAFPTSYVIDKQGRIRYALFGATDWNTKDIRNKIEILMKED